MQYEKGIWYRLLLSVYPAYVHKMFPEKAFLKSQFILLANMW